MILSRTAALTISGIAAAALVGTAGIAAATAAPGGATAPAAATASASPTPSAAPGSGSGTPHAGPDRARRHRHGALGRGLHGEFVVKDRDGAYVTLAAVRGEVTAVSASSITIKAEDGFTATYTVTDETRVRGKDAEAIADVEVGDRAGALGVKSGSSLTARLVHVRG